jgi:hypothetical protein
VNETDHGEAPPVGLNCGATSPPRLTRSGLGRGLTWSLHSLTRSNSKRGNARQCFGKKSRPWNRVGQEPNTIPSAPPYGHSHFDLTDQALAAAAPERRWFDSPPLSATISAVPDRIDSGCWLFPPRVRISLSNPGVRASGPRNAMTLTVVSVLCLAERYDCGVPAGFALGGSRIGPRMAEQTTSKRGSRSASSHLPGNAR